MPMLSVDAQAALRGASRTWTFTYKAVTLDALTETRDLNVEACKVSNNALADKVKRTCDVTIAASSPFDPLSEMFRPYATLQTTTGALFTWCLGTFFLSSNTTASLTEAGESGRQFTG